MSSNLFSLLENQKAAEASELIENSLTQKALSYVDNYKRVVAFESYGGLFEFSGGDEAPIYSNPNDNAYLQFFQSALKKFGVQGPNDFNDEQTKQNFFNYVDKGWKTHAALTSGTPGQDPTTATLQQQDPTSQNISVQPQAAGIGSDNGTPERNSFLGAAGQDNTDPEADSDDPIFGSDGTDADSADVLDSGDLDDDGTDLDGNVGDDSDLGSDFGSEDGTDDSGLGDDDNLDSDFDDEDAYTADPDLFLVVSDDEQDAPTDDDGTGASDDENQDESDGGSDPFSDDSSYQSSDDDQSGFGQDDSSDSDSPNGSDDSSNPFGSKSDSSSKSSSGNKGFPPKSGSNSKDSSKDPKDSSKDSKDKKGTFPPKKKDDSSDDKGIKEAFEFDNNQDDLFIAEETNVFAQKKDEIKNNTSISPDQKKKLLSDLAKAQAEFASVQKALNTLKGKRNELMSTLLKQRATIKSGATSPESKKAALSKLASMASANRQHFKKMALQLKSLHKK